MGAALAAWYFSFCFYFGASVGFLEPNVLVWPVSSLHGDGLGRGMWSLRRVCVVAGRVVDRLSRRAAGPGWLLRGPQRSGLGGGWPWSPGSLVRSAFKRWQHNLCQYQGSYPYPPTRPLPPRRRPGPIAGAGNWESGEMGRTGWWENWAQTRRNLTQWTAIPTDGLNGSFGRSLVIPVPCLTHGDSV